MTDKPLSKMTLKELIAEAGRRGIQLDAREKQFKGVVISVLQKEARKAAEA